MAFQFGMSANFDPAKSIAGKAGLAGVHKGTGQGLRKAIAMIERVHKRSSRFMLPGGGKKNPVPPLYPFIRTRTGTLKKSYTREVDYRAMTARYGSDLKYAQHIEEGTRPHEIRPAKAKALAFMAGGKKRFSGLVLHPGIRARKHMPRLAKMTGPAVEKIMADEIVKGLSGGK